ncbi:hypothetical protein J4232_00170 [Candidatus Woesearchaeota archaeon]|nr:hypothetical protein [Candidatus Woesearchaeota archaeon]
MAKTKEEMSQADLIMEYYKKHPKREIPHPEIVDWVVDEFKQDEFHLSIDRWWNS